MAVASARYGFFIIGFSRNILIIAESLYRDIIVIVSHVS